MIKRTLTLTAILIAFALLQHNECAAHGFGGYHNAAIRAAAVNRAATLNRGINIGVNAAPYRRYSYPRYPAPLPIAPYYPALTQAFHFPTCRDRGQLIWISLSANLLLRKTREPVHLIR